MRDSNLRKQSHLLTAGELKKRGITRYDAEILLAQGVMLPNARPAPGRAGRNKRQNETKENTNNCASKPNGEQKQDKNPKPSRVDRIRKRSRRRVRGSPYGRKVRKKPLAATPKTPVAALNGTQVKSPLPGSGTKRLTFDDIPQADGMWETDSFDSSCHSSQAATTVSSIASTSNSSTAIKTALRCTNPPLLRRNIRRDTTLRTGTYRSKQLQELSKTDKEGRLNVVLDRLKHKKFGVDNSVTQKVVLPCKHSGHTKSQPALTVDTQSSHYQHQPSSSSSPSQSTAAIRSQHNTSDKHVAHNSNSSNNTGRGGGQPGPCFPSHAARTPSRSPRRGGNRTAINIEQPQQEVTVTGLSTCNVAPKVAESPTDKMPKLKKEFLPGASTKGSHVINLDTRLGPFKASSSSMPYGVDDMPVLKRETASEEEEDVDVIGVPSEPPSFPAQRDNLFEKFQTLQKSGKILHPSPIRKSKTKKRTKTMSSNSNNSNNIGGRLQPFHLLPNNGCSSSQTSSNRTVSSLTADETDCNKNSVYAFNEDDESDSEGNSETNGYTPPIISRKNSSATSIKQESKSQGSSTDNNEKRQRIVMKIQTVPSVDSSPESGEKWFKVVYNTSTDEYRPVKKQCSDTITQRSTTTARKRRKPAAAKPTPKKKSRSSSSFEQNNMMLYQSMSKNNKIRIPHYDTCVS